MGQVKCVAITARGLRCGRATQTEYPITFEWDPTKGHGTGGPGATLCRLHDYLWDLEPGECVEIVGGWLGRAWNPKANVYTVMTTVYEARDSLFVSPHWWALRRPIKMGYREPAYDQVVSETAPVRQRGEDRSDD